MVLDPSPTGPHSKRRADRRLNLNTGVYEWQSNLFSRQSSRTVLFKIIQPAIEFLALSIGQRNGRRVLRRHRCHGPGQKPSRPPHRDQELNPARATAIRQGQEDPPSSRVHLSNSHRAVRSCPRPLTRLHRPMTGRSHNLQSCETNPVASLSPHCLIALTRHSSATTVRHVHPYTARSKRRLFACQARASCVAYCVILHTVDCDGN